MKALKNILFATMLLLSTQIFAAKSINDQMIDAAYFGYTETLTEILKNNEVNINYQDRDGRTAIWYASYWEHIDAMKVLIAVEGMDPNIADYAGFYPLETAIWLGHWEVEDLLREAGAIEH